LTHFDCAFSFWAIPVYAQPMMQSSNRLDALKSCLKGAQLRRALTVSLIVGSALTAINQGDLIAAGAYPPVWKIALTFLVPFLVTTYGAYSALTSNANQQG
jgi:hypothetical protein